MAHSCSVFAFFAAHGVLLPPPRAAVYFIRAISKGKGEITFANRFFYLGAAFAAHQVALEATETDGLYHARLHAHAIGQIDLRLPTSKAKGCYCPPGQNIPLL
jgi:hypothetical protein